MTQSPRSPSPPTRRLLLVEDDAQLLKLLTRRLSLGWRVTGVDDGLAAFAELEAGRFDAVLADENIPGPKGVDVLERARELMPAARLVLFSGWVSFDARERAPLINAIVLEKGCSLAVIIEALEREQPTEDPGSD